MPGASLETGPGHRTRIRRLLLTLVRVSEYPLFRTEYIPVGWYVTVMQVMRLNVSIYYVYNVYEGVKQLPYFS